MSKTITIDAKSGSNGVRSDIVGSWASARTDDPAKETTTFITQAADGGGSAFQCGRYFGFFDLNQVIKGSKIDSATLIHPQVDNKTDDDSGTVHIVEHEATIPTQVADFNNYKSLNSDTSFGEEDLGNISTSTTVQISVNSDGLNYIRSVLGEVAKIGLRSNKDFNNTAPTGNSQYTCNPEAFQLEIVYTPPSSNIII